MEQRHHIDSLYEKNIISSLDYYFSLHLLGLSRNPDPLVGFSLALLSKANSLGHICLDTDSLSGQPVRFSDMETDPEFFYPARGEWQEALARSDLVSGSIQSPMVLDPDGRLYLARMFDVQTRLVQNLKERLLQTPAEDQFHGVMPVVEDAFGTFSLDAPGIAAQKQAVLNGLTRPFSIITGGPGTGKTSIARTIITLIKQHPDTFGPDAHILCVAPTGKAASRFEDGSTIHRALGMNRAGSGVKYHRKNPLFVDTVIIDEASMIDLVLMTRFLEAIPTDSRIIMIGDPHQLSSVESGAVFKDICQSRILKDHITPLEYNFRSTDDSDIDRISKAIRSGDTETLLEHLTGQPSDQVEFIDLDPESNSHEILKDRILHGYGCFFKEEDPERCLDALDRFKVLSPFRHGLFGTTAVNTLCKNILRSGPNFDIQDRFVKRAVMINKNDYQHNLFNGDTGVVCPTDDGPKAFFRHADDQVSRFDPNTLGGCEDAFAVTIHKSQGSEYDHVLMILPSGSAPFITRQLLYTGFTRARRKITLVAPLAVIAQAITTTTQRPSNISGLLDQY